MELRTPYMKKALKVFKQVPCLFRKPGDGCVFYLRRDPRIKIRVGFWSPDEILYFFSRNRGLGLYTYSFEDFLETLEPDEQADFLFHLDFLSMSAEDWYRSINEVI